MDIYIYNVYWYMDCCSNGVICVLLIHMVDAKKYGLPNCWLVFATLTNIEYGYTGIYHLNVSNNHKEPHLEISNTRWCPQF